MPVVKEKLNDTKITSSRYGRCSKVPWLSKYFFLWKACNNRQSTKMRIVFFGDKEKNLNLNKLDEQPFFCQSIYYASFPLIVKKTKLSKIESIEWTNINWFETNNKKIGKLNTNTFLSNFQYFFHCPLTKTVLIPLFEIDFSFFTRKKQIGNEVNIQIYHTHVSLKPKVNKKNHRIWPTCITYHQIKWKNCRFCRKWFQL